MEKQYAIFDMDGTLVDSMTCWNQVVRTYLESIGAAGDLEPVIHRTKTMSVLETAQFLAQKFPLPETVNQAAETLNRLMEARYREDIPVKPEVPAFLRALKERGVRLCTASATSLPLVEVCLERLGIREYFDFCLSTEEVGVGKSQPDVYLEAVRRLHGSIREAAVFEDSFAAMKTAKAAGFYVVGVYDREEAANWEAITEFADETVNFS